MVKRNGNLDGSLKTTPTAAEIQRQLHDKRDSIHNTVAEMKATMSHEYQHTKDSITQTFDWKYQMRQHPIAACVGAVAVGYLAGRGLGSLATDDNEVDNETETLEPPKTQMESLKKRSPRHLVSPGTKSRITNRVENVFGELAENFLGEVTRVGRDVLVPSIIAALTAKFTSSGTQESTSDNTASGYNQQAAQVKSTTHGRSM